MVFFFILEYMRSIYIYLITKKKIYDTSICLYCLIFSVNQHSSIMTFSGPQTINLLQLLHKVSIDYE